MAPAESRIAARFRRLRESGERALVAFLSAGDPAPDHTPALALAMDRGGADILELGVPFSDPIADGPVIQRASARALAAGTTVSTVLEIARRIRAESAIPIVLFTYLNPVLRYGLDRLAEDAAAAGIDGCLLTDLSVEEADPSAPVLRAAGLDTVFLAAPTSTDERLALVARYSSGFVYVVSRAGVTGERAELPPDLPALIARVRATTPLPVAVGFGISKPDQSAAVGALADGVVVGSAFVRMIETHGANPDLPERIEDFTRSLKAPLRSAT